MIALIDYRPGRLRSLIFKSPYFAIFVSIVCILVPTSAFSKEIHKEKSLYRNIIVKEQSGRRCLVFTLKRGDRNQTCMDLENPRKLVFPYVRMTMGGLLVNSKPDRMLIIGLGGGSIPLTLGELFPNAHIDIVEIDEAVIRVARKYFNFVETSRVQVHVADARVYIKRAGLQQKHYDLIILDAFTGDYIPEHLMTTEFLQETKQLLTREGLLVANTFSTSELYDHESVTYQEVFGDFLNFRMPSTGNRVILASMQPLPSLFALRSKAKRFSAAMDNYGVDIESFPKYMSRKIDWDASKRALTDQYNPANLLQGDSY
ncbi:MAG: fused MFS/spermidine synthase [bacterium]|nr:methyltransferase domain-containing protein [Gammaproteobacteria bacterium]HIL95819.1 methyltransferase domain-containing protein [Pseudomonadales bacterium]